MKKNMKFLIIPVLFLLLFCFVERHGRRRAAPPTTCSVRVLESLRSPYFLPQYLALNLGFFKEQNLDVIISTTSQEAIRAALYDGRTDIALCGLQKIMFYPGGNNLQPKVFATLAAKDGSLLLTRKENGNFQWKNLKDKTVIGGSHDDSSEIALEYVLRQNGLPPYRDVTIYNNIPDNLRIGAFRAGTGNYIQLLEPDAALAESKGIGQVAASVGDAAGEMIVTAYAALPDYIEKNPEVVQKFVNAIYKAQLWLNLHSPAEAAEAVAPSFPNLNKEILLKSIERYRTLGIWADNPLVPVQSFERFHSAARQAGEIPFPVTYESTVVNDFARQAVETVVYVPEEKAAKKFFFGFLRIKFPEPSLLANPPADYPEQFFPAQTGFGGKRNERVLTAQGQGFPDYFQGLQEFRPGKLVRLGGRHGRGDPAVP